MIASIVLLVYVQLLHLARSPSDILIILNPPLQNMSRIRRRQRLQPELLQHRPRLAIVLERPLARRLERHRLASSAALCCLAARLFRRLGRQVEQIHALAQLVHGAGATGDVPLNDSKDGAAVVGKLRGAERRKRLLEEHAVPEQVLQFRERSAPDAAE